MSVCQSPLFQVAYEAAICTPHWPDGLNLAPRPMRM